MPEGVNVEEELVAKLENGVLWLTINRADKGNAIPYYVRDRLTQHFWDAHADLDVRAIVLTARGRAALLHRRRPLGSAAGRQAEARRRTRHGGRRRDRT